MNEPPEPPEPPACPACADGYAEFVSGTPAGLLVQCDACGHKWEVPHEHDIEPLEDVELPEHGCAHCGQPTDCIYCSAACSAHHPCPHGLPTEHCPDCAYLSDLAFDAAREQH